MHNDLTNLLPPERQQKMLREYLIRVGIIATALVAGLILIGAILLIPTYVLLSRNQDTKQNDLTRIESTPISGDAAGILARLDTLKKNTKVLAALASVPSVSSIVRALLAVPRPGITISSFLYTPAVDATGATLVVSGSSATRDALRGYQLALQGAPSVRSAALPVSAYAKDADINFTVTVTLTP